jgi:hypothetical protein
MSDTPPASRPPLMSRRTLIATAIAALVLLTAGVWIVSSRLSRWMEGGSVGDTAPTKVEGGGAAADARKIHALLFYLTDDGAELQASSQEVLYGATPAEQARRIIEAQLQPAAAGRTSAIPAGTQVRSVFVGSKGDAYVDFSPDIRTAHPGGSLNEALAVFTIVNALTSNLPGITSVQILVDGKEVDSLAGHIDLRHPLSRADGWVRKGQ